MAKKSRRVRKQGQRVRLSPAQMVQPEAGATAKGPSIAAAPQSAREVTDLRQEYQYVMADLRRIGVIAVAMLAALIILAFVLT